MSIPWHASRHGPSRTYGSSRKVHYAMANSMGRTTVRTMRCHMGRSKIAFYPMGGWMAHPVV